MAIRDNHQHVRYRFLLRPFICYVPSVGGFGVWAWHAAGLPEVAKLALMAGGILVWTLIEYLLHRFLLHYHPQAPALLSIVAKLHLGHHRDPQDEVKITVPVPGSLPIAGGLLLLFRLTAGSWEVAALLLSGSVVGYLYYEAVHFWIHCGRRGGHWLGQRRTHHYFHHFKAQTRCFGVSTALWDLVMGTERAKSWPYTA